MILGREKKHVPKIISDLLGVAWYLPRGLQMLLWKFLRPQGLPAKAFTPREQCSLADSHARTNWTLVTLAHQLDP